MKLSDWLIVGVIGFIAKNMIEDSLDNSCSDSNVYHDEDDDLDYDISNVEKLDEFERIRLVNQKRRDTPCKFQDSIDEIEFEEIVRKCCKKLKRIKSVRFDGPYIFCTVESQSGLSNWEFRLDFNNWGHITDSYWLHTDNVDSCIPSHLGQMISESIYDIYSQKGVCIKSLANYVELNTTLETQSGLSFNDNKFLRIPKKIYLKHDISDLIGEHVYPVISILKNEGFKIITTSIVEDIDSYSNNFVYEVESISFGNSSSVSINTVFKDNVKINIVYHAKRKITLSLPVNKFLKKDFNEAVSYFSQLGFSNISLRSIPDLKKRWIKKENGVEYITINKITNAKKGLKFYYDAEIVIGYHTFK